MMHQPLSSVYGPSDHSRANSVCRPDRLLYEVFTTTTVIYRTTLGLIRTKGLDQPWFSEFCALIFFYSAPIVFVATLGNILEASNLINAALDITSLFLLDVNNFV